MIVSTGHNGSVPDGGVGGTVIAPDWYINASTGNDSNSGTDSGSQLATWAGLMSKWGYNPILSPPLNGDTATRTTTVHIQTDLPESDPVWLDVTLGQDGVLDLVGTATAGPTGTFTAVTAKNAATNTRFAFTDGAVSAAFWASHVGKRVRITSGARQDATMWVQKNLGARNFNCTDPSLAPQDNSSYAPFGIFAVVPEAKTPAVTDPYRIETIPAVTFGSITIHHKSFTQSNDIHPILSVRNLEQRGATDNLAPHGPSTTVIIQGCKFNGFFSSKSCEKFYNMNSLFVRGAFCTSGPLFTNFAACGVGYDGITDCYGIWGSGSKVEITYDTMLQACGIKGFNVAIQSSGIFDNTATAYNSGDAVQVGGFVASSTASPKILPSQGMVLCQLDSADANIRLWGANNSGVGVATEAGNTFVCDGATPTVTGTGGDFKISGEATGRAWDETVGAYTAAVNCTWALLSTAIIGAGFGGSAHNVAKRASVITR